tara:strand:- start:265 stop:498 length:234 start_codon:yes stop_codon:yes gene_type:complete
MQRDISQLTIQEKQDIKFKCWTDYHQGESTKQQVISWAVITYGITLHAAKKVCDMTVSEVTEIMKQNKKRNEKSTEE